MPGAGQVHSLAIAADAFRMKHAQVHLVQHQHILRPHGSVPHHSLIFLSGAAVVALAVAAIGAQRVAVHIDRLIGALGTGHADDHDVRAVHLLHKNIPGRQDIDAGLIGIVDDIPELPDEPVRIGQIDRVQGLVRPLLYAQQDDPAIGIGEGRVCLPNALRQAAKRFFCLNAVILPILFQFGKIDHSLRSFLRRKCGHTN